VDLWHQKWVGVVALTLSSKDLHNLGKWQMGKKILTYIITLYEEFKYWTLPHRNQKSNSTYHIDGVKMSMSL
jgi:hypothetical protein